jgi:hypothetical protein
VTSGPVPAQAVGTEPDSMPAAAGSPGERTDELADGDARPANGANAPADNPELADTLPARELRRALPGRGEPAADAEDAGDAVAAQAEPGQAEPSASAGASALAGDSRGTPGMSQPGSVIARLPPRSAREPSNPSFATDVIARH